MLIKNKGKVCVPLYYLSWRQKKLIGMPWLNVVLFMRCAIPYHTKVCYHLQDIQNTDPVNYSNSSDLTITQYHYFPFKICIRISNRLKIQWNTHCNTFILFTPALHASWGLNWTETYQANGYKIPVNKSTNCVALWQLYMYKVYDYLPSQITPL